jgi:hypothetical protein
MYVYVCVFESIYASNLCRHGCVPGAIFNLPAAHAVQLSFEARLRGEAQLLSFEARRGEAYGHLIHW